MKILKILTLSLSLLMIVSVNCLNAVHSGKYTVKRNTAGDIGSQVGKGFADSFSQSFNQSYNNAYRKTKISQSEQRELEQFERKLELQYQAQLRLEKEMADYLRQLDQQSPKL